MQKITVSVEGMNGQAYADHVEGMAVVRLDGEIIANLLTGESIEFTIDEPQITTERKNP